MILTREQILQANDRKIKKIAISGFGGDVCIRQSSALDYARWADANENAKTHEDRVRSAAGFVVRTMVDEQGNLIFSDADIESLMSKRQEFVLKVFNESLQFSMITDENVREIAGNSSAATTESSISG